MYVLLPFSYTFELVFSNTLIIYVDRLYIYFIAYTNSLSVGFEWIDILVRLGFE
jgi:hypothetical protein